MALDKKAVNDHFLHSFGQVDEPVRSQTGNDGLIVGGICENSGTVTAVEHGDFAALHFDNDQNLMVNVVSGEIVASLGTVDLIKSGTIGVVSSVTSLAAGTINSVANLAAGTLSQLLAGTITQVTGGAVAANAADSGNPIKVGGKYTAAGVTLDDGDRGDLAVDSKSNLNVNLNTLIAGEDQSVNGTTGVLCTEQRFSYSHYVGTVAGTVKAAAGFLHAITVNTVGTSPVTVYDSVGTSATVIGVISGTTENTKIYDVTCATGITVLGTSAIDLSISYR